MADCKSVLTEKDGISGSVTSSSYFLLLHRFSFHIFSFLTWFKKGSDVQTGINNHTDRSMRACFSNILQKWHLHWAGTGSLLKRLLGELEHPLPLTWKQTQNNTREKLWELQPHEQFEIKYTRRRRQNHWLQLGSIWYSLMIQATLTTSINGTTGQLCMCSSARTRRKEAEGDRHRGVYFCLPVKEQQKLFFPPN